MAGLLGNVEQVNSSHTSGEKRLVGVAPGSVHDQATFVGANSLRKRGWTLLDEDVPPTLCARSTRVDLVSSAVEDLRDRDFALELGLANLALDLAAIDCKISEICEELLSTVLGAD
jgi:hypothetical protein